MIAEHDDNERHIVWKVYCPRCLTLQPKNYTHVGLASACQRFPCSVCRKSFDVRARVAGDGAPLCESTPVFIRAPEIIEDNDPPVLP